MKRVVATVILIVGLVGMMMVYQIKVVDARVDKQVAVATEFFKKENNRLLDIIKEFKQDQQKFINQKVTEKELVEIKVDFDKWDCWCALRNKLRQGEDFSVELDKFREVFSGNSDLLNLVETELERTKFEGGLNELTNNLLKFAKIRSISESGLEKISGYVLLLSIKGMKVNE